jgi:hypothetical protein
MAMTLGIIEQNVITFLFQHNPKMENKHISGYLKINACHTSQTHQHYPAKRNIIKPEACTI